MQELRTYAVVEPDAARDILHIRAQLLAKVGHFVDEGDLGRKECVRRIFDQFGRTAAGKEDRRFIEEERAIDPAHHFARPFGIGADNNAVRPLEIANRRAFAQELWVGDDFELQIGPHIADDALDLVTRSHRHGRFGDHDGLGINRFANLFRGRIDIA